MFEHESTFTTVTLQADLSRLGPGDRKVLSLLLEAAAVMDVLYWAQAHGDRDRLLSGILDEDLRRRAELHYGPWDRLKNDAPFVPGVGPKPPGAAYYPEDMTIEEFDAWDEPRKKDPFSLVRRDGKGRLFLEPYREAFRPELSEAARLLEEAASASEHEAFARYLRLRARALLTDAYRESDIAWLGLRDCPLDIIIGPIENYEDRLLGFRNAYEAYVLIQDPTWSRRLSRIIELLPDLQSGLPVPQAYKAERPGTGSDIRVCDVLLYAGECNAGAKTIAVNLPNDEELQLSHGTRSVQLKNAMGAKFEKILLPIAERVITPEQRQHVKFAAFFNNTLFHELAHGLGIKRTLTGGGSVREAHRDLYSPIEEGKADIVGLDMVLALLERGELDGGSEMDHLVTFVASLFRSIRFGVSSAHGQANLMRYHFLLREGALVRDEAAGTYRVEGAKMKAAVSELSARLLILQGDGDYEGARSLVEELGGVPACLAEDLSRIRAADIPEDIVFRQGHEVLGV